jgi:hypothetical protein
MMEELANRPEIFIPVTILMMGMVYLYGVQISEPSKPTAKEFESSQN